MPDHIKLTISGFILIFSVAIFIIVSFYYLYEPPLFPSQENNTVKESLELMEIKPIADPGYRMDSPGPRPILPTRSYRGIPIYANDHALETSKDTGPGIVCIHEPFESTSVERYKRVRNREILFINAYTNIIYVNPGLYSPNGPPLNADEVIKQALKNLPKQTNISFFGTYRGPEYTNKFPDLRDRQELAIEGKNEAAIEIYGNNWPFKVEHNSRQEDQQLRYRKKLAILRSRFAFSLASENCCVKTYISEKIWHAIEGHTVPIYKGGNGIDDYFPPDSYIDPTKFPTPKALFKYLRSMSEEEYASRLRKCVQAFNQHRNTYEKEAQATKQRILKEMDTFYDLVVKKKKS